MHLVALVDRPVVDLETEPMEAPDQPPARQGQPVGDRGDLDTAVWGPPPRPQDGGDQNLDQTRWAGRGAQPGVEGVAGPGHPGLGEGTDTDPIDGIPGSDGLDHEIDRIIGLEIGGDDYVSKPFSPRELIARIKVILKRTAPAETAEEPDALTVGAVSLWPAQHRVEFAGGPVELTATEFQIVRSFLRRLKIVRDRNAIIDAAYADNIHVSDRTVDSHIRHIRLKFQEAGCASIIETVHGVGYKLGACT